MLLVRIVNLFDQNLAQVELVHQHAGVHGSGYGQGEVHFHQPLRDSLSSGDDVVTHVLLVVGAQVVLEVDLEKVFFTKIFKKY